MRTMTLLIFAVLFCLTGPPAIADDRPGDSFGIEQAELAAGIGEFVATVSAGSQPEQFIIDEFHGIAGPSEKDPAAEPIPRKPPRIIEKCGTYLFLTLQRFWPPGFSRAGR